jgi:hypothetical protein
MGWVKVDPNSTYGWVDTVLSIMVAQKTDQ